MCKMQMGMVSQTPNTASCMSKMQIQEVAG